VVTPTGSGKCYQVAPATIGFQSFGGELWLKEPAPIADKRNNGLCALTRHTVISGIVVVTGVFAALTAVRMARSWTWACEWRRREPAALGGAPPLGGSLSGLPGGLPSRGIPISRSASSCRAVHTRGRLKSSSPCPARPDGTPYGAQGLPAAKAYGWSSCHTTFPSSAGQALDPLGRLAGARGPLAPPLSASRRTKRRVDRTCEIHDPKEQT
jgi:hypothetical protein